MTLIERLKDQRDRDAAEHCPAEIIALQDETIAAIEAQEVENKRLQQETINRSCNEAKLRAERDALAAKQLPLTKAVPTWKERKGLLNSEPFRAFIGVEWEMQAEINELRAAIDAAKGGQQ